MGEMISVIVPVYNVAEYLGECIDSILAQTYRDLELILVDDGSTDGSGGICDEYAAKDKRVRVIHRPNGGVSCARNTGLDSCTGELIGFVDADDWLDLRMYEKLARCLNENKADAAMCGFVDYPHGKPVKKGLYSVLPCDYAGAVYQMMRHNGYFTSPWAKLFRRDLLFLSGGPIRYDPALAYSEDEVWLLEVLRNCRRTAFLPEPLYYWRPREGSVGRADALTEKQMTIIEAKSKTLSLLPDDAAIRLLARGQMYNDCFNMKVKAYCGGNKEAICRIDQTIRAMRHDLLRTPEIRLVRKLKIQLIEMQMLLRLPKGIVSWTNKRTDLTRNKT